MQVRLAPDRILDLEGGELIGRAASAQVVIDDPRVSEAHAFVAHRGASLCLQALRGPLLVDGHPQREVRLEPGTVVQLAPEVVLEVLEASNPGVRSAATPETLPWLEPLSFRVTLEGVELRLGDDLTWFRGKLGLLLAEMLRHAEPVTWTRLTRSVWPRPREAGREEWEPVVRKRLDAMLRRLRDGLRDAGVKRALVQAGSGQIGLTLRASDHVTFED